VLAESRLLSSLDHPFVLTLYTAAACKIWVGDKGERKRAHQLTHRSEVGKKWNFLSRSITLIN
jgi:hypothetical protein